MLLHNAPVTAAMGAVYTIGVCMSEDARGKRDWKNTAIGSAAAGAIAMGIKRKSLQAAFVGSIMFGLAGAASELFHSMEPNIDNRAGVQVDEKALAATSIDFANAAASSAALTRRLQ